MKRTFALSLITLFGTFASQINAGASDLDNNQLHQRRRCGCSNDTGRCPIDIRQGPGFWNLEQNPYTEEIYDDESVLGPNFSHKK